MSYYGKFPQFEQYLTDVFTSSATTYSAGYPLTYNPGVAQAIEVYVGGAQQRPNVDYVINNQTLIFSPAIPDGLSIFIRYLGVAGTPAVIQDSSVTTSKIAETILSKSVAGGTDVTLSALEAANSVYQFTGNLTGNINVIVPNNIRRFIVVNSTAGNFTLTVKTVAGTGVLVVQGTTVELWSDGVNVYSQNSMYLTQPVTDVRYGPLKINTLAVATALDATYQGAINNITAVNTQTLPALSTLTNGQTYVFEFESEVINAPVACNAADTMTVNGTTGLTSFKMNPGSTLRVVGVGGAAGAWVCKYTPAAEAFDNSATSTDIVLHVGESCYSAYSGLANIPLHVACDDNQLYDLSIQQPLALVSGATVSPSLAPNNTTYTNMFYTEGWGTSSGAGTTGSGNFNSGMTLTTLNAGNPGLLFSRVSTKTTCKVVLGTCLSYYDSGSATAAEAFSFTTMWCAAASNNNASDNTTLWTSLGTVLLPIASTGRTLVRRIE